MADMEVIHARCAGLDVHKKLIVACLRLSDGGRVVRQKARFGTTTTELTRLATWMTAHQVTHAVMESTGVYWRPVWHVLERDVQLVLANAQHVKAVPGRKSDMTDAEWLAELLAHGLIRGSFVPPERIQELRALTRTRKQLSRAFAKQALRIQKVLEDANVKLSSVVSDILGRASRAILEAIIAGETSPERLARLKGQLKAPLQDLEAALQGRVSENHRFLLRLHLDHVDAIQRAMDSLDRRLEQRLEPFREHVERLTQIPGVSTVIARVIVAEVGLDMSRFPTPQHLISWAGLCPRLDESAGRSRSRHIRKGNPWLKVDLTQAAMAARRAKHSYLRAQFNRLASRRGVKKAVVAVAASILTSAYVILRDGVDYRDLGADYLDRRDPGTIARRLVDRIKALGFSVELHPAAKVS
jgi:transposase